MQFLILKNKKGYLVFFIALLLIISIIRFFTAIIAVKNSASESEQLSVSDDHSIYGWGPDEIRNMIKDLYWLEGQLMLAGSDSMIMTVNLDDKKVGLQLKGLPLLNADILRQYPENFLSKININAYSEFAKVTNIEVEKTNALKKPVKKVGINKEKSSQAGHHDPLREKSLLWTFYTGNEIKVTILGVDQNNDSVFVINHLKDIALHQIKDYPGLLFSSEYCPSLFLWLSDKDARAIYRAMPEKGKVLFRN